MKTINKDKFDKLVTADKIALLADMRSPVSFRDGHIDGSTNLPLKNFVNKIMGMPRDAVVVAYSTTLEDVDLVRGLNYAEQLGFTKVHAGLYGDLK